MYYEQVDDHAHKSPEREVRQKYNPTRAADAHENLEGKCNAQSAMQRRGKERGVIIHDLEEGGVQGEAHTHESSRKGKLWEKAACVG